MSSVLEQVRRAFGSVPRPEHFTDYRHCPECAEHDETLRSHTPDTIGLDELGNLGWDPICFASVEAYLYYLPGLARLALGSGEDYYLAQFLFHLNPDRIGALNAEQRLAILELLTYLRDQRLEDAESQIEALEDRIRHLQGQGETGRL